MKVIETQVLLRAHTALRSLPARTRLGRRKLAEDRRQARKAMQVFGPWNLFADVPLPPLRPKPDSAPPGAFPPLVLVLAGTGETSGVALLAAMKKSGCYGASETYVWHHESLSASEHRALERFAVIRRAQLLTRRQFLERVFWRRAVAERALIVGWNVAQVLAELADDARWDARGERWILNYRPKYRNPKTGEIKECHLRPRIYIKPLGDGEVIGTTGHFSFPARDARPANTRLPRARVLDLKALTYALTSRRHDLAAACQAFGGEAPLVAPTSAHSRAHSSLALLNALAAAYEAVFAESKQTALAFGSQAPTRSALRCSPEALRTPAQVGKLWLEAMGIKPPSQKSALSEAELGIAAQAYHGPRIECRISKRVVPVIPVDFSSQYPAVFSLMNLERMFTAESLTMGCEQFNLTAPLAESSTRSLSEARALLESATLETLLRPETWPQLACFCKVIPAGDVLPSLAPLPIYERLGLDEPHSIVAPLTASFPIWFCLADLVASKLLTGRCPEILEARALVPRGEQSDLRDIYLAGGRVRPNFFARDIVAARTLAKAAGNKPLADLCKIALNSVTSGALIEARVERVGYDSGRQRAGYATLDCHSGCIHQRARSAFVEFAGKWTFEPIASLVLAGGRLLIAMLESMVRQLGGDYMNLATDALGIVAEERRRTLHIGGETVNALSLEDVRHFCAQFEALNPWPRLEAAQSGFSGAFDGGPFLRIEDENFKDGAQTDPRTATNAGSDSLRSFQALSGYAIATMRYCWFDSRMVRASAHSLGHLDAPKGCPGIGRTGTPLWIEQALEYVVLASNKGRRVERPVWFDEPVTQSLAFRKPGMLPPLHASQGAVPYAKRVKPYATLERVLLRDGAALRCEGRWLDKQRKTSRPLTYGDYIKRFAAASEPKGYSPARSEGDLPSEGILEKPSIHATGFRLSGKETQYAPDGSVERARNEYTDARDLPSLAGLRKRLKKHSAADLAGASGLSERQIRRIRDSKCAPRRETHERLSGAVRRLGGTKKERAGRQLQVAVECAEARTGLTRGPLQKGAD